MGQRLPEHAKNTVERADRMVAIGRTAERYLSRDMEAKGRGERFLLSYAGRFGGKCRASRFVRVDVVNS